MLCIDAKISIKLEYNTTKRETYAQFCGFTIKPRSHSHGCLSVTIILSPPSNPTDKMMFPKHHVIAPTEITSFVSEFSPGQFCLANKIITGAVCSRYASQIYHVTTGQIHLFGPEKRFGLWEHSKVYCVQRYGETRFFYSLAVHNDTKKTERNI